MARRSWRAAGLPVRTCATIGALCFAIFNVPALAQDADNDIVVEGTLEVDGTAARAQADAITQRPASLAEPLARWQDRICAGVSGLSVGNAEALINRMYDTAELVGLRINETPGCNGNVWVIVVDDAAETVAQLQAENSWMIRGLSPSDVDRLAAQEGPVRAWNVVSNKDSNGAAVATGHDLVPQNIQMRQQNEVPMTIVTNMSRLQAGIRLDIDLAVMLVDRSAILDFDAFTLADYAAMRLFVRTDQPVSAGAYNSITSLFVDDLAPARLTPFDRAYLRSSNQGDPYRPVSRGMASFDELMEQELLREAGQLPEE